MKIEISPQDTTRAQAFELWMSSPMPMVTLVKIVDVTKALKYCKKHKMSFNMLLCWCIGKAASQIEEFFTIPEQGKLYRYDQLAINVIVENVQGGINSCDIPFSEKLDPVSGRLRASDSSNIRELSEQLSRRLHDYRHISHDSHRT